jgi:hypothetical protein
VRAAVTGETMATRMHIHAPSWDRISGLNVQTANFEHPARDIGNQSLQVERRLREGYNSDKCLPSRLRTALFYAISFTIIILYFEKTVPSSHFTIIGSYFHLLFTDERKTKQTGDARCSIRYNSSYCYCYGSTANFVEPWPLFQFS